MIRVSAIVAVADNGVIGRSGSTNLGLPWHIKSEFQYFKNTTLGHPVIHGRKSFEALGKPLPKRPNIVVTRDPNYKAENVTIAHTVEEAIDVAKNLARQDGKGEIFICGGAEIYRLAMPVTDRLYYTEIHLKPEGDTFFPDFDRKEWQEVKREFHKAEPGEDADYTITVLDRK
nr:Dihydrofolate reductase [uncultured bacterium]